MEEKNNSEETTTLNMNGPGINEPELLVKFIPKKSPQILAALAATIGSFALGTVLGWSSPAIPNIEKEGQFGSLTNLQKSWIGSLVPLGAVFSGIVAGFAMERIGKKLTMILLGIPFVVGWLIIVAATNLHMILFGRFITGFCGGAFTLVVPVYVSETVEDNIRGTLSTVSGILLVAGILFVYILGAFTSWIHLSIVCGIIPVICMICLIFVPESPRYLLERGRIKAAALSLLKLRGASIVQEIETELRQIEKSIQDSNAVPANFKDFFEPSVLKPICLSCMLMVFQQLGGVNAVVFYTVYIFESAGSDIDAYVSTIIVGIFPVIMVTLSAVLVDKVGRKILFVISDAGMTIGLVALGVFFTLKENNDDKVPANLGWLPLASLILYVITYNIALGPLPWVMMGELLPPHIKGLAGGLACSFNWFLAFLVTFSFNDLYDALGPAGCYYLFGGISFIGVLFAIFIIPETKGKSLDEIQALFKSK